MGAAPVTPALPFLSLFSAPNAEKAIVSDAEALRIFREETPFLHIPVKSPDDKDTKTP